jgi:prolyl-tRNA editing enzyme YbaK/EbsC (Cys-tRNA(Pro) deacylase)
LRSVEEGETDMPNYSAKLTIFLTSADVWHRFVEFSEPVKTVEQARRKVPAEKIAKSIVMVDSEGSPLLAIVKAQSRVSHRKIKRLLAVRDVRLATPDEVLRLSGYPVGGVPPFNQIKRVLLDPEVLKSETCFVGGGDVNKLMEIKTDDLLHTLKPEVAEISDEG